MRNNETGEFELIVGNRQLLSGFFIVVLLFAVAFAMGYVVGQNSPRSAKVAENTAAAPQAPSEPRPQPAGAAAQPQKSEPTPAPTETAAAQQPAGDSTPQQPPAQQPAREPEPPKSASDLPVVAELPGPAGSYWQVTAVAQADAEIFGAALKKKGFPVILNPGPKNLMRVIVGPYQDTAAMGKAKTDLENAGFLHPIRR
jgi:cell division septation protein DedD